MTSWIAPTPYAIDEYYTASEDAIRVDDFQYLYDHRHDVLYVDRTQQTLANSTTKTAVATYSVPAGTLSTNGILRVHALVRAKCTSSNANNVTISLEYGGTVVGTAIMVSNNDTRLNSFDGWLIADGATNVQAGIGQAFGVKNTAGVTSDGLLGTLAVDSTVAQDLILYCTNSRLNADASWTYFYYAVFGLP